MGMTISRIYTADFDLSLYDSELILRFGQQLRRVYCIAIFSVFLPNPPSNVVFYLVIWTMPRRYEKLPIDPQSLLHWQLCMIQLYLQNRNQDDICIIIFSESIYCPGIIIDSYKDNITIQKNIGQKQEIIQLCKYNKMRPFKNKQIESEVRWILQSIPPQNLPSSQLTQRNKQLLNTLKKLQLHLDKQLQTQRKHLKSSVAPSQSLQDKIRAADETIKNNEKYISILQKQQKKLIQRQKQLSSGLPSKMSEAKIQLQSKIAQARGQIRKCKLQQASSGKLLHQHQDPSLPQSASQNLRLQEQLKVYSKKYVKLLDRYNKVTDQLAMASNLDTPDVSMPDELYDKQLQEREEAQFKEYQGIVKMASVLARRNDSETNKHHRVYTEKLKQFQGIISRIADHDRIIQEKEEELMEGKKHIDLAKNKVSNEDDVKKEEIKMLGSSQRKSYSVTKLGAESRTEIYRKKIKGNEKSQYLHKKYSNNIK